MRRALIVLFSLAATLAAQPSLTSYPCSEAATLRSAAHATTDTQVQFANGTAASMRVYWIDSTGQRRLYSTLLPGASNTQATIAAHVWLVTDVADGSPVNKWYRMPKTSTYNFVRGVTFELHKAFITDALTAGDSEIDYQPHDIYKSLPRVCTPTPRAVFSASGDSQVT